MKKLYNNTSWSDELRIGNKEIDADHKAFFELGSIIDCALERQDIDQPFVSHVVTVLVDYVRGHFAREEILMGKYGYTPWVKEHIAKHEMFTRVVTNVSKGAQNGSRSSLEILSRLCTGWITEHILQYDIELTNYFGFDDIDTRDAIDIAKSIPRSD